MIRRTRRMVNIIKSILLSYRVVVPGYIISFLRNNTVLFIVLY